MRDFMPATWHFEMATKDSMKEVLVAFGERKRTVGFKSSPDPETEKNLLVEALKTTFGDILKDEDKNKLVISVKSERWGGEFVELHGDMTIEDNSICMLSVGNTTEMRAVTIKAQDYCERVGKLSEKSAAALKKLYPVFSQSNRKRKFDPADECVVASEKRKKKATSTRNKPRIFFVVFLPKKTVFVPKGYTRTCLAKKGRVLRIAFRRNMNEKEIKDAIVGAFSNFKLDEFQFLKCGQDNRFRTVNDNNLDGDGLFELAGQGSIYICLNDSSSVPQAQEESPQVISSDTDDDEKHTDESGTRTSDDINPHFEERTTTANTNCPSHGNEAINPPSRADEAPFSASGSSNLPQQATSTGSTSVVLSGDDGGCSSGLISQESLQEWRVIRQEQDIAFEESLQADKEKAARSEARSVRKKRIDDLRCDCVQFFQNDYDGAVKVAFKEGSGKKMEFCFSSTSSVKDLYRYVLSRGVPPPFSLSVSVPRLKLSLSVVGDDNICCHQVADSVIMIEECDQPEDEVDHFLDALEISSKNQSNDEMKSFQCRQQTQENERITYMMNLDTTAGFTRTVHRCNIYEDVMRMYASVSGSIVGEYPIRVRFEGEMAVDQGGVTREMYSAFWETCYSLNFDGSALLVPMLCPQSDISLLPVVGTIISHGYLVSGYIPVRIALPCLIGILCGPGATIPNTILQEAFLDYISATERDLFTDALNVHTFSPEIQENLLSTLSRFGCRRMPTPSNLMECLLQVANFEFCCKPAAAISMMHSGIPSDHAEFWNARSVEGIHSIYRTLAVSCRKVLDIITTPDVMNPAEMRIHGYLVEMIGNMSTSTIQRFLRFTTGSSVLTVNRLQLTFNRLEGFTRRPIAHTCDCVLELPVSYANYSDFHSEWMAILNDPELSWFMDSI